MTPKRHAIAKEIIKLLYPGPPFAAPVFLFAEQSPLLAETADLRIYDLSVFNVNRAAEVLGVAAACQRIGIF